MFIKQNYTQPDTSIIWFDSNKTYHTVWCTRLRDVARLRWVRWRKHCNLPVSNCFTHILFHGRHNYKIVKLLNRMLRSKVYNWCILLKSNFFLPRRGYKIAHLCVKQQLIIHSIYYKSQDFKNIHLDNCFRISQFNNYIYFVHNLLPKPIANNCNIKMCGKHFIPHATHYDVFTNTSIISDLFFIRDTNKQSINIEWEY